MEINPQHLNPNKQTFTSTHLTSKHFSIYIYIGSMMNIKINFNKMKLPTFTNNNFDLRQTLKGIIKIFVINLLTKWKLAL